MAAVTRTITDDQLAQKTPCREYDVRALVNHLLFWGPSLAGGGRKMSVPQPATAESDVDLAGVVPPVRLRPEFGVLHLAARPRPRLGL